MDIGGSMGITLVLRAKERDMNKSIKAHWVAVLRSGDYAQCPGTLRKVNKNTEEQLYCCLGVLTDLAIANGIGTWDDSCDHAVCKDSEVQSVCELVMSDGFQASSFADSDNYAWSAYLPHEVKKWAGMSGHATEDIIMDLMEMNDYGDNTFEQIADFIESSDIL
jgi:hypothetical protein